MIVFLNERRQHAAHTLQHIEMNVSNEHDKKKYFQNIFFETDNIVENNKAMKKERSQKFP